MSAPRRSYANSLALFLCCQLIIACHSPTPPGKKLAVDSRPTLRVGTSGDYPPFSHWPEGAPSPSGFSIDLAQAYAASTGRTVEWTRFAWPTLAAQLAAAEFDFALSGVTIRPDRSISGRFSVPLTISGAVVLTPEANALGSSAGHDALNAPGVGIAVNAGGHLERTARTLFPAAQIFPIPNNGAVLEALDRPEVDAVVTDTLEAPIWLARRKGLRAIGPLTRDRKGAWFPVEHATPEIERLDAWLIAAEADGALGQLRAIWKLPEEATATPSAALLARLDERLSLMQAVAQAKYTLGREIEDRDREARVVRAAGRALEAALESPSQTTSPPIDSAKVERFYRAQIEAAKWIQWEWTRRQAALSSPEGSEAAREAENAAAARRLENELRPALLFLGDRIAALVAQSASAEDQDVRDRIPTREAVAQALARHDLPAAYEEEITESVSALLLDLTNLPPR